MIIKDWQEEAIFLSKIGSIESPFLKKKVEKLCIIIF